MLLIELRRCRGLAMPTSAMPLAEKPAAEWARPATSSSKETRSQPGYWVQPLPDAIDVVALGDVAGEQLDTGHG